MPSPFPSCIAALMVALSVSGCTSMSTGLENDAVNSIPFDEVSCPQLTAQRNALAARHGLPSDATRQPDEETRFMGLGPLLPDSRTEAERERAQAVGTIDAMNRSLTRRAC